MDSSGRSEQATWWVVCLCADWCGVCREWQPAFSAQARAHAGLRFAWVDVEDEDEAMGDVDIETFPTLLVARDEEVLFLGPIPPSSTQFTRLLATLQAQPVPAPGAGDEANELLRRLKPRVLPQAAI
jgi:thioredoxin 1